MFRSSAGKPGLISLVLPWQARSTESPQEKQPALSADRGVHTLSLRAGRPDPPFDRRWQSGRPKQGTPVQDSGQRRWRAGSTKLQVDPLKGDDEILPREVGAPRGMNSSQYREACCIAEETSWAHLACRAIVRWRRLQNEQFDLGWTHRHLPQPESVRTGNRFLEVRSDSDCLHRRRNW